MDKSAYCIFLEPKAYPVIRSMRSRITLDNDNSDKTSPRTRQMAQQRVELAYAYGPIVLAYDRRVFDVPSEAPITNL